jgi:hypothetical protein
MKDKHSSELDEISAYLVERMAVEMCFPLMLLFELSFQTSIGV